jgi:hypothetical protein
MKRTIWKSYGMYSIKELEELEQSEREHLKENNFENYETTDVTDIIYEEINLWFEDETSNLYKQLDGRILAIASMGLWNGRKTGYKILGDNLNEVLTSTIGCDEKEVYFDGYNIKAEGYHHDGRNFVEYREIREDKNIDKLLDKIYMNKPISRSELNYYTKPLGKYVKQIFGW